MVAMIANGWHLRQMGKSSSVQNVTLTVNLMRLKNGLTLTQIVRKEKIMFWHILEIIRTVVPCAILIIQLAMLNGWTL